RQIVNEYLPEVEVVFDNQYAGFGPPFGVRAVAVQIKLEVLVCMIYSVVIMDIQHFLPKCYAECGSVSGRTRHGECTAEQFNVFVDNGEPDAVAIIDDVARRGKLAEPR